MPKFKVKIKQNQSTKSVIVEADNNINAMRQAQKIHDAIPLSAKRLTKRERPQKTFNKKLKFKDLLYIFQEMYILISSGISLKDTLEEIAKSTNEKDVQMVLDNIIYGLNQGKSFSSLMAKYYSKDSIVISILEVGEKGGDLDKVLDVIINYLEDTQNNISNVTKALSYPLILVVFTVVALALLLTFVVPQFKEIFASFSQGLPIYTTILIQISDFVILYGKYVLAGVIASVALFIAQYKISKMLKLFVDKILLLHIFIVSKVLHLSAMYKMTSSLEVLLFAGINVVDSLEMIQRGISNAYVKARIEKAMSYIKNGKTLAFALRETDLLKNSAIRLIFAGENVGKTPEMMKKVSDMYRKDLNDYIQTIAKLIEPILLIFISFMVLFIALSIFMPMWSLSSNI